MKWIIRLIAISLLPLACYGQGIETRFISASPVVDTSINASGDNLGGKLTFTAACNSLRTLSGEIRNVIVVDQAKQSADMDLVIFNADPTGTTFTTNAALDVADADMAKVDAVIPITTHKTLSDNGISTADSKAYSVHCTSGGVLYGALVSRGTPTYAAASDLQVTIVVVQD